MTNWNIDRFDILSKPLDGVSGDQDLSVRKRHEVDSQEVDRLSERFEALMDNRRDGAKGEGGSSELSESGSDETNAADLFRVAQHTREAETRAAQVPPSELLETQAGVLNSTSGPVTESAGAELSRTELATLLDKVANQIYIRVPDANEQEVVIRFADSVLPDTEVSIKLADGQLTVDFTTGALAVHELLNAEVDDLQSRLLSLIANPEYAVKISVRTPDLSELQPDAEGDSPTHRREQDSREPDRDQR